MILKFERGLDFLTLYLPTKFYHPTFNHSVVIELTNKQRDSAENNYLTLLCYTSGKYHISPKLTSSYIKLISIGH